MRRLLILLPLLAACGDPSADLRGTWTSERDADAQVTLDGGTATVTRKGLAPTIYQQQVERKGDGYVLLWTAFDGEKLMVNARLDGDRLQLNLDGQEFALRRAAVR